jgi:hypothetical protein
MPKRQEQAVIDPLMVSDRERHGKRVGASSSTVEELQPELRPGSQSHYKAMVKHRQPRGLQNDPANLRVDVRSLLVPAPRANHIARSD